MKKHYEKLGVDKTAKPEEIKKAYRKKAKENHPDKGGDAEEFSEISEAYRILIDPVKRLRYDKGDNPDETEEKSKEVKFNQAMRMVIDAFIQCCQSENFDADRFKEDPFPIIYTAMRDSVKDCNMEMIKIQKKIVNLKRLFPRLKHKKGENKNPITIELQYLLEKFQLEIKRFKHQIEVFEMGASIAKEYSFDIIRSPGSMIPMSHEEFEERMRRRDGSLSNTSFNIKRK